MPVLPAASLSAEGSSRWRRPGDRNAREGWEGGGGYRQKDLHGGSTASQIT